MVRSGAHTGFNEKNRRLHTAHNHRPWGKSECAESVALQTKAKIDASTPKDLQQVMQNFAYTTYHQQHFGDVEDPFIRVCVAPQKNVIGGMCASWSFGVLLSINKERWIGFLSYSWRIYVSNSKCFWHQNHLLSLHLVSPKWPSPQKRSTMANKGRISKCIAIFTSEIFQRHRTNNNQTGCLAWSLNKRTLKTVLSSSIRL